MLFLVLLIAGSLAYWQWAGTGSATEAAAMGFDLAAVVFMLSIIPLLRDSNADRLRIHAAQNDANRVLVLVVTTIVTTAVLAVIAGELPRAQAGEPFAMARLVGTLTLTWLFANTVYAMHYAHLYYSDCDGGDRKGLEFPDEDLPDYLDFIYFSFTQGMTFQTSDVQITGREIRRVSTLHSLAAFVFNIGVVAFTINALG